MSSVQDSVIEVFSARFDIDKESITLDATFDDLGLDSLSQLELATAVKKRLGVEISDEELSEISVVSDLISLVEKKGVNAR